MTAALIPEGGLEPLGVWDTHDHEGPWRHGDAEDHEERWALRIEAADWAKPRIDRTEDTYRVEFYLLDAPFAVVWRHRRDAAGRLFWNPEERRPYKEEPVIVPLTELPPAHLLGRA